MGTEAAPFQHKANITMYGDNSDPEIPMYGNKVIAVRYGTLDMHGKAVSPSWTRLGATAAAGATHFTLSEEVRLPNTHNVTSMLVLLRLVCRLANRPQCLTSLVGCVLSGGVGRGRPAGHRVE